MTSFGVVSEEVYGDRVIGSWAPVTYEDRALVRGPGVEQPVDDAPGKPIDIWARVGRRPIFAAGNSDGDVEMLSLARFALLVHHDDAHREFAYDAGAERAPATAGASGWSGASIERDFARVF